MHTCLQYLARRHHQNLLVQPELVQLAQVPDREVIAPVALEGDIGSEDDADYDDRLKGLSRSLNDQTGG